MQPSSMIHTLALVGLGHFGYAWLRHFDRKNDPKLRIRAYDINEKVVESLHTTRKHPYLHPTISIQSPYISFEKNKETLMHDCDTLLLSVASEATRPVMQAIKPYINQKLMIVNTSKALDAQTGQRLSVVINEELTGIPYRYALLAGGTIAEDLFNEQPLGIDLASQQQELCTTLVPFLQSKNLHVYPTTDLIGVEYASAFKNVISILAGIVQGAGYAYGTETYCITQAAAEVEHLVTTYLGGTKKTFQMSSQCWGNDLWMSCTGETRNKECGILLGKGMPIDDAIKQMAEQQKMVEGIKTISILHTLPHIETYPLLYFLYKFITQKSVGVEELKKLLQ